MATRILIVEDEAIAAMYTRRCLKELGYEVIDIAVSGEEALEIVERTIPDLILMDIKLGGQLDGIETAEEIYRRFDVPVMYVTAHGDDRTRERAKKTHPRAFVEKPVEEKMWKLLIEDALKKVN